MGGLSVSVSQLTKPQDVRLSRHIGMASGPSLGVILTSEKLPTIGCSGLHARGLNSVSHKKPSSRTHAVSCRNVKLVGCLSTVTWPLCEATAHNNNYTICRLLQCNFHRM